MSDMIGPILVTGAAGLVGRHVTDLLRSRGVRVVAHARRPGPGIDWAADLADPLVLPDPERFDVAAIVHCATAIPARSDRFDPDNTMASSTLAASLSTARSLKRIVHLSSVAVYQRPAVGRWLMSEYAATVDGVEHGSYAASKRASELSLDAVGRIKAGVAVTHLRASSIYGPGMVRTTLLPALVARALQNEPLLLRGTRPYFQNFVHVADVAELAVALLQGDLVPAVVNAFSDDTYELVALAEVIRTKLGSSSRIVDESHDEEGPRPVFVNQIAKRLHPAFRRLADHLADAS
jgi:nucleoside-diphosphate-sugar epimerase